MCPFDTAGQQQRALAATTEALVILAGGLITAVLMGGKQVRDCVFVAAAVICTKGVVMWWNSVICNTRDSLLFKGIVGHFGSYACLLSCQKLIDKIVTSLISVR